MNVPIPIPPLAGPGSFGAAVGAAAGAAARAVAAAAAREGAEAALAPEAVVAAPFPPPEIRAACERLAERYPTRMAALLPTLLLAQRHFGGWVSPEVEAGVARWLEVSPAHVRGVLTFYSMFHTEPRGRHEVWVCRTLSCWLRGARELAKVAREKAGLPADAHQPARTGPDGRVTVMEMECLGLCEAAPAVFVDGEPHVLVTPERLGQLLDGLK